MSNRHFPDRPLLGAAVAIWRGEKVLLVERKAGPSAGSWAMPGGLVEVGETLEQAAVREVLEETALTIENPVFNRMHEIIFPLPDGRIERHYVLAMFVARCEIGNAVAGDDAGDVSWCSIDNLDTMKLTPATKEFVEESRAFLT